MKFICLAYIDEAQWAALGDAVMEACLAYDDKLRRGGHTLGAEALQPSSCGVTLRVDHGKVAVTDGPFSETKELIAGYWMWHPWRRRWPGSSAVPTPCRTPLTLKFAPSMKRPILPRPMPPARC